MFTDRAPFEYRYLSRRLLRDMFDHDGATRRRWGFKVRLAASVAAVELANESPDHDNLHYLASRAEAIVSDHTGDLSEVGGCIYLKADLDLRFGVFSGLRGWLGGEVACYSATVETDAGATYVALFGSASNVVGYRGGDTGSGFYPSDLYGICELLDLVREPNDPPVDEEMRWDEVDLSTEGRISAVLTLANGSATKPIGRHQILLRMLLHRGDVSDPEFEGRVIVGTPLWIATPRPVRPFNGRR